MASTTTEVPPESRKRLAIERRDGRLCLAGELTLKDCAALWRGLHDAAAETPDDSTLDIDLSDVSAVDGAVVAIVTAFRAKIFERGGRQIIGAHDRARRLVQLYHGYDPARRVLPPPKRSFVEQVGDMTFRWAGGAKRLVTFFGDLLVALVGVVWKPITANWHALFSLGATAGAEGVPVVVLLTFLVGFVMGVQSARQLSLYGANVFVADVVGISVTRELGPLVTAIVVIGRSGAAFAAEIGTMKVSDELDALRTMGVVPTRYLVLPRIAALVLVTPVLTLLGDVVGVAGGAVIGALSLGVSPRAYLTELRSAILIKDVVGGLVKSVFFGFAIALIACQQGLATRGGATGVGRRTTATVVHSLVAIVVIDAFFAVLFRVLNK